jgi:hypothetical protein
MNNEQPNNKPVEHESGTTNECRCDSCIAVAKRLHPNCPRCKQAMISTWYKKPYQHICEQCSCGFRIERPFNEYTEWPDPVYYFLPLAGIKWHPATEHNNAFCMSDVEVIWEEIPPPEPNRYGAQEENTFCNPFEQDLDPYRDMDLQQRQESPITRELQKPFMYDNKNRRVICEIPEMLPFDVSMDKLKLYLLFS